MSTQVLTIERSCPKKHITRSMGRWSDAALRRGSLWVSYQTYAATLKGEHGNNRQKGRPKRSTSACRRG